MIISEDDLENQHENVENKCQNKENAYIEQSMTEKVSTSEDESNNCQIINNVQDLEAQCEMKQEEEKLQINSNYPDKQSEDLQEDIKKNNYEDELKQNQSVENDNKLFQEQIQQITQEFSRKNDQLQCEVIEKEKKVQFLQNQLQQLQDQLKVDSQNQCELSDLQRKIEAKEKQLKQLIIIENENEFLKKSLNDAQKVNKKLSASMQTLKSNCLLNENQLKNQLNQKIRLIAQVTQEFSNYKQIYENDLEKKEQEFKSQIDQLRNQVYELQIQNKDLQLQVEKHCKTITNQYNHINKLKADLQNKEDSNNQIQEKNQKIYNLWVQFMKIIDPFKNLFFSKMNLVFETNAVSECVRKQKQQPNYLKKFKQICMQCKALPNESILNQISEIINELKQKPASLMLSQSDQANQMLMKILFPNLNTQLFQMYYSDDLDNFFINTEAFEFEEIDERERQLLEYKKIFKENPNKFNCIWIAVKFERTDLMKKSITSIYKFVYKLKIPISIVVTDFHLSEDQEEDKKELRTKLKLYNPKHIIFVGQFTTYEELIKELEQALPEQSPNQKYPMNLEKTIFEDEDEEKQQRIMEQIQSSLNVKR